jgi:hypothetical protein
MASGDDTVLRRALLGGNAIGLSMQQPGDFRTELVVVICSDCRGCSECKR